MWKPRRLTTLWASTSCYRESFVTLYSRDKRNFPVKTICLLSPGQNSRVVVWVTKSVCKIYAGMHLYLYNMLSQQSNRVRVTDVSTFYQQILGIPLWFIMGFHAVEPVVTANKLSVYLKRLFLSLWQDKHHFTEVLQQDMWTLKTKMSSHGNR
jgi:hypothetical protein